ncbi:hypothetical protein D3C87_1313820 [compost metagenome]
MQVRLNCAADLFGQPYPVLAKQSVEGARGEVVNQDSAGGAANQHRHIGTVIGRGQRRLIAQTDAIDEAHVHVDDLKALLVGSAAGDHLGFVVHMAGVPQAIGNRRGRAFSGVGLNGGCGFANTGGQLVNHAILDAQHPAQWPRQTHVQAWTEHLHWLAESFVDATPLQGNFVNTGQRPANQRHHRQHRQERPTHVSEGPDLPQIDAEAVMQFVLQRQQWLWWPAQHVSDKTARQQLRLKAVAARTEQ